MFPRFSHVGTHHEHHRINIDPQHRTSLGKPLLRLDDKNTRTVSSFIRSLLRLIVRFFSFLCSFEGVVKGEGGDEENDDDVQEKDVLACIAKKYPPFSYFSEPWGTLTIA